MMDNLPPSYAYGDALGEERLRILTIKPSVDFCSEIRCELAELPRVRCGDYTALSYCWGPEKQAVRRIMIGTSSLEIRDNLATALRYLRRKHEPRKMWIDAICINQNSTQEKTAQVRRMADTYKNSTAVVVWLGASSETEKTSVAIAAIDALGSQLADIALKDVPTTRVAVPATVYGCEQEDYALAMINLLKNGWFKRVWVIQEICLAPTEVTLMCGRDEVSFWKFVHLQIHPVMANLAKSIQQPITESGHEPHRILALANEPPIGLTRQYFVGARKGHKEPGQIECTLLSHLWNFRNRDCEDPRDRVYAMLGIAKDDFKPPIDPNYSKSKIQVYMTATRAIIENYKHLYVMAMCQGSFENLDPKDNEEAGTQNRLPSWVPDFSLHLMKRPTSSLTKYTSKDHYYSASGTSEVQPKFLEQPVSMELNACSIDEVEDVGYLEHMGKDWGPFVERSRELAKKQKAKANPYTGDGEDAFWRTLITNRSKQGTIIPAEQDEKSSGFDIWWRFYFHNFRSSDAEDVRVFLQYNSAWLKHFPFRNFFTTRTGYIGLGPSTIKVGDAVYLLPGSQVPFVLRKHGENYRVVGECYVHGIMDGGLWNRLRLEQPDRMIKIRLV